MKKPTIKRVISISKLIANSPFNLLKRNLNLNSFNQQLVVFSLTDKCNSKCKHCNIWKTKSERKELTAKEIGKIFSYSAFKNLNNMILSGGEITLRSDLKEVVFEINKANPNMEIWFSTNALLPNKIIELVKFCAKKKMKIGVGISLDGIGKKHDEIRGVPGNFEKVDYLVKELIKIREKYPIGISVGITISDLTIDSIKEVKEYAKKHCINFVPQIAEEAIFYNNLGESKQTKEKILEFLYSLNDTPHRDLCINYFKGKDVKFPCFSLERFFLLHSNGDVAPCLKLSNIIIGNLNKQTPEEIWKSKETKKAKELIKNCKGCLNTWAWDLSAHAYCYPLVVYTLKKLFKIRK